LRLFFIDVPEPQQTQTNISKNELRLKTLILNKAEYLKLQFSGKLLLFVKLHLMAHYFLELNNRQSRKLRTVISLVVKVTKI
jgi:hypothetical protein